MPSFLESEYSREYGEPVELYDISFGANAWHYTNSVEVEEFAGTQYTPIAIKRGETEDSGDATKANIEITIPRNSILSESFKAAMPSEPISLTVRQFHRNAPPAIDPTLRMVVIWKGRIVGVAWRGDEMVMTSESIFASLLRTGVNRKYSRQCTHTLYGKGCMLQRDEWKVIATPSAISGTVLTIDHGKDDNWFAGGFIVYRNAQTGATERRVIKSNNTSSVTLLAHPIGMEAGETEVALYAGCDHTVNACANKFDNVINYGGQPYIPIMNPFGGSPIY